MNKKIIFFILLIVIPVGIYYHTNTLMTTHYQLKLSESKRTLKIAHISDLHSHHFGELEKQLIASLKKEKPDLIVITGDLTTPKRDRDYSYLLRNLHAPLGVYFILGNWEYWAPINHLDELLANAHITNLTNKFQKISEDLWLVGFDDSREGNPDLKVMNTIPSTSFKIGLFHSPQFFDKIAGKINLGLAGHSHGGQLRIPFIGEIWTPEGTGPYVQGWYYQKNSHLFVSRGIGTSVLPVRFNCSPELAMIHIVY